MDTLSLIDLEGKYIEIQKNGVKTGRDVLIVTFVDAFNDYGQGEIAIEKTPGTAAEYTVKSGGKIIGILVLSQNTENIYLQFHSHHTALNTPLFQFIGENSQNGTEIAIDIPYGVNPKDRFYVNTPADHFYEKMAKRVSDIQNKIPGRPL